MADGSSPVTSWNKGIATSPFSQQLPFPKPRRSVIVSADFCTKHALSTEDALSTEITPFQQQLLILRQNGITALLAENDQVAELIFLACRTIGLRIPEDLCLCGFDDTSLSRSLEITSIHQDFESIGREASRILLSALENPAAEPEKIVLPVTLVPRASSLRMIKTES